MTNAFTYAAVGLLIAAIAVAICVVWLINNIFDGTDE